MAATKEVVRKVKRIFIASPGDLAEERKRFPKILENVNKLKAHSMDVHLEPLGWEDTLPGCGRPQDQINKDVECADLLVMLLWKRWGTPPAENSPYSSGTEEEFELARRFLKERGVPNIYLYFCQVPEAMMADPGEQLRKVLDFRKKIEAERALLFKQYGTVEEWEDMLMEHIARWLDGFQPAPSPSSASIPADVQRQIEELEKELSRMAEEHKGAQARLREAALEMGHRATVAAENGRLTEAEELFARAVQTYSERSVINAFGLYYKRIGSLKRAEEKFLQLEQLGKEQGDKSCLAVAYGNLGIVYKVRGDLNAAEEMHRKALALDEELADKKGMADDYGSLGLIYRARGNLEGAEELLHKTLAIHRELGDKKGMANDYGNLGLILQTRGYLDGAEEMHRKSLALEEELGRKEGMASDYVNLGIIYRIRGDLDTAEEMTARSLSPSEQLGSTEGMANAYGNFGLIHQDRGDLKTAEDMHRKGLALSEELGNKEGVAIHTSNLGVIHAHRGELESAEEAHRKALALSEELGNKEGMAIQYNNLGLLYQARGDLETAESMLRKALSLFEEVGAKPQIEQTRKVIAELGK